MEFAFQDSKCLHKIKVFGIGGGGNNAINNMITAGLAGPIFVAANSDLQDLEACQAPHKVQVGTQITKGLGCGGKAEIGRQAALEDIERIKDMLADSDMVFITAGMGGGTGSGGAPVVAEALSKMSHPPLIVAVVTKPFPFEGPRRMKQAEACIKELTEFSHSIITVPNEKLLNVLPKGGGFKDAMRLADDVLLKAVQGITDLITGKGYMNVDFQDIKTIMTKRGPTIMGIGQSTGEDRAVKAAMQAISSPLLDDLSIQGARGVLINITASEETLTMDEVNTICTLIQKEAHTDSDIISGVAFDQNLKDGELRVTLIATGLVPANAEVEEVEDVEIVELATPAPVAVEAAPVRESKIIDYNKAARPVERQPAGAPAAGMGGARRPRDLTRSSKYEMYSFDDEILDSPTYLRVKAD